MVACDVVECEETTRTSLKLIHATDLSFGNRHVAFFVVVGRFHDTTTTQKLCQVVKLLPEKRGRPEQKHETWGPQ